MPGKVRSCVSEGARVCVYPCVVTSSGKLKGPLGAAHCSAQESRLARGAAAVGAGDGNQKIKSSQVCKMLSQHQISYIIKHIGLESNNFDCGKAAQIRRRLGITIFETKLWRWRKLA